MNPRLRQLLPSLLISLLAPILVYGVVRGQVHSDVTALAIGAAVPVAWTLARLAIFRRLDPIGLVGVAGFGIGLLVAWLSGGDPIMLELRDAIPTGLLGLACLVSAVLRRPLVAVVVRLLARRNPSFPVRAPRVLAVFNLMIGALLVVHSAVLAALALSLPVTTFVIVSRPVGWSILAVGALGIWWYRRRVVATPVKDDVLTSENSVRSNNE